MNRMKTAFKAVRDYLGRDTKGIELLQKAEILANELRTENASLRQQIEDATKRSEENYKIRIDSDRKLVQEVSVRHSIEAKLVQSQRTIEKLQMQLQPPPPKDEKEQLSDGSAIVRQLKSLSKDNFEWPTDHDIKDVERVYGLKLQGSYNVAAIIRNWSGGELIKLGRFVAYQAITGKFTTYHSSVKHLKDDEEWRERIAKLILPMMRITTAVEDLEDAIVTGSTAQRPRLRRGEEELINEQSRF